MRRHRARHSLIHAHLDHAAGDAGAGRYACDGCTYEVTVFTRLPNCPMCGGGSWSAVPAQILRLGRRRTPAHRDDQRMAV
jgi:hypothetical protein